MTSFTSFSSEEEYGVDPWSWRGEAYIVMLVAVGLFAIGFFLTKAVVSHFFLVTPTPIRTSDWIEGSFPVESD